MAGIAALLWSKETSLTNEDIGVVLERTARDSAATGWDAQYGWGLVRADTAMRFVACDNVLKKNTATGYGSLTQVAYRTQYFRNVAGIPPPVSPAVWQETMAKVWRVKKSVTFPDYSGSASLAGKTWARGRLCTVWADTTHYDGDLEIPWANMDNVTASAADIYGYFYQVWNPSETTFYGWFPFNPLTSSSSVHWEYAYVVPAVQRHDEPLSLISAPRLWSVPHVGGTSSIHFLLVSAAAVQVTIVDAAGRAVRTWQSKVYESGKHIVEWDGISDRGSQVASGVYFVQLAMPQTDVVREKLVLY